jgi:molecular chaperone GrpE
MQSNNDKKKLRRLIYDLLWAIDDLDRILNTAEKTKHISPDDLTNLQHTRKRIMEAMMKAGVSFDGELGEDYNPRIHEVLEQREDAHTPANQVIDVFEVGCSWDGQRIRHAKVAVSGSPTADKHSNQE